ncbi:MAG: dTDP-4-dehydrorhamnose 3,5-epimerase [Acidobacteria bacterium]|nr:dTDP-4-dehydrorhamnose 3,5-epimerase [Acidobacteriota bacterium]
MNIEETSLPGVLLITPRVFSDSRGAFWETWNHKAFEEVGMPCTWVQDNFSVSKKNVIRGLHYQITQAQGKLVRVAFGAVLDVAVDLRRHSPYFGKHVAVELNEDNARMLWVPEGFGHGFLVLSEKAGFAYKVTDYYNPKGERTIVWNDPELAIQWPVKPEEAIVSDKDAQGATLATAEVFA